MATSITNAFVRQYERDVHHVFQRNGGILRRTVRTKDNVVGRSTTFQKIGKGTATTKARHGVITPMNQTHTAIEVTLSDFYAGDWVDKLDEAKVNIDERMALATGGARALGRKVDDQIITALNGTSQTQQSLDVSSIANVRQSFLEWVSALWANDVMNDGMVFGYLTPRLDAILMTVEEYASADYVNVPRFEEGAATMRFKNWLGVNWAVHTGASGFQTASATAHVWHQESTAYATGATTMNSAQDEGLPAPVHADITWHGDRAAHFVNHWMSGGAGLIDDTGVIEATWDDTAVVPAS